MSIPTVRLLMPDRTVFPFEIKPESTVLDAREKLASLKKTGKSSFTISFNSIKLADSVVFSRISVPPGWCFIVKTRKESLPPRLSYLFGLGDDHVTVEIPGNLLVSNVKEFLRTQYNEIDSGYFLVYEGCALPELVPFGSIGIPANGLITITPENPDPGKKCMLQFAIPGQGKFPLTVLATMSVETLSLALLQGAPSSKKSDTIFTYRERVLSKNCTVGDWGITDGETVQVTIKGGDKKFKKNAAEDIPPLGPKAKQVFKPVKGSAVCTISTDIAIGAHGIHHLQAVRGEIGNKEEHEDLLEGINTVNVRLGTARYDFVIDGEENEQSVCEGVARMLRVTDMVINKDSDGYYGESKEMGQKVLITLTTKAKTLIMGFGTTPDASDLKDYLAQVLGTRSVFISLLFHGNPVSNMTALDSAYHSGIFARPHKVVLTVNLGDAGIVKEVPIFREISGLDLRKKIAEMVGLSWKAVRLSHGKAPIDDDFLVAEPMNLDMTKLQLKNKSIDVLKGGKVESIEVVVSEDETLAYLKKELASRYAVDFEKVAFFKGTVEIDDLHALVLDVGEFECKVFSHLRVWEFNGKQFVQGFELEPTVYRLIPIVAKVTKIRETQICVMCDNQRIDGTATLPNKVITILESPKHTVALKFQEKSLVFEVDNAPSVSEVLEKASEWLDIPTSSLLLANLDGLCVLTWDPVPRFTKIVVRKPSPGTYLVRYGRSAPFDAGISPSDTVRGAITRIKTKYKKVDGIIFGGRILDMSETIESLQVGPNRCLVAFSSSGDYV